MAIILFVPFVPNFTKPILGMVIFFLAETQTGIIMAGKIAGIINHVLKFAIVRSQMAKPESRI
jgi:hypothetical protein